MGPMMVEIYYQVRAAYEHYGLEEDPSIYYRVIDFKEEEYAFLVIEMNNTTAARFID